MMHGMYNVFFATFPFPRHVADKLIKTFLTSVVGPATTPVHLGLVNPVISNAIAKTSNSI